MPRGKRKEYAVSATIHNLRNHIFGIRSSFLAMERSEHIIGAYLASYQHSGGNWLRSIISRYLFLSFDLVHKADIQSMFEIVPNLDLDPDKGLPAYQFWGRQPPFPLIATTHATYRGAYFQRAADIIFIVRDPRDILVSAYFHAVGDGDGFDGDIDEFILDSDEGLPSLIDYLNNWANHISGHRHFVLGYEALRTTPEATMAAVLAFLGCEVDMQAVRQAIAASQCEETRVREAQYGILGHDHAPTSLDGSGMRQVHMHEFCDYLTSEVARQIQIRCSSGLSHAAKSLIRPTGIRLW